MRDAISNALPEYFKVLVKMPHVDVSVLVPFADGWEGVEAPTLRVQGKTAEAIGFIRHLPCLNDKSALTLNS